jgi:hypothetical protein
VPVTRFYLASGNGNKSNGPTVEFSVTKFNVTEFSNVTTVGKKYPFKSIGIFEK